MKTLPCLRGCAERSAKSHPMRNLIVLSFMLTIGSGAAIAQNLLRSADSNAVPTLIISSNDVVQSSVVVFRRATNGVFIKFQYTEMGSNRVRAFYESHLGEIARFRVGAFEVPPWQVNHTNTTGRDAFWGLAEKDADAVLVGLRGRFK